MEAKGGGSKHAAHIAGVLDRLHARAGFAVPADLAGPAAQAVLAAMAAEGKSARTVNHALAAFRAFAGWLEDDGRLDRAPRGMAKLARFNEDADRRVVRRALTVAEMGRLLSAAHEGRPIKLSRNGSRFGDRWITGPERATLWRLAIETGFRAEEIRTLTVGRFALDGLEPTVTVTASYAKNGRTAVQPISVEFAAHLKPLIAGRAADMIAIHVPEKTAKLLRHDLAVAGISVETPEGIVDFHALRHSFITAMVDRGVKPKVAQVLARHSSVQLTLGRYAHAAREDIRRAVEGGEQ